GARIVAADDLRGLRESLVLDARFDPQKLAVLGGRDPHVAAPLRVFLAARGPLADECGQLLQPAAHCPAFILSRSSARRSIDSLAPDSMPDATMPSRSITDWKTWCATSFVLLPRGSNVAVCSATW